MPTALSCLRWLGPHPGESGLRSKTLLAALPTSNIPRRCTPRNFKTGSYSPGLLCMMPPSAKIVVAVM